MTHSATIRNRYCADELQLTVEVRNGTFVHLAWTGHACALCRQGAEVACEALAGRPLDAVADLHTSLDRVLEGATDGPYGAFTTLRDNPSRASCVRLALRGVQRALTPDEVLHSPSSPAPTYDDNPWSVAESWQQRGLGVAIATLIDVVGSSPCPLGSHLVVASDGTFWGAVSGGCVEGAVVQAGLDLLSEPGTPTPRVLTFRIANSQAGEVGLPCGGEVRIHIAAAPGQRLLRAYQQRGRGLARVLDLRGAPEQLQPDAGGSPRMEGDRFIQPIGAQDVLVLVGGTRIAQILAQLARPLDFDVQVIEPRAGFATPGRFNAPVHMARAAESLPRWLGPRTAVVVLTHDDRIDDEALELAAASDALYVGALGSRKTHRRRIERLRARGVCTDAIHGPAGLAIGAIGPSEIALSILAEVVQARRNATPSLIVGAVVLAAPTSQPRRVRHAVQSALDARLSPCMVVVDHDADGVRAALDDLPVTFVQPRVADGVGASIAAGIDAIADEEVSAALVVPGHLPGLRARELQRLAEAHIHPTRHLPIIGVDAESPSRRRALPVLWPRHAFAELSRLTGTRDASELLRQAGGAVLEILVESTGDIDPVPTC